MNQMALRRTFFGVSPFALLPVLLTALGILIGVSITETINQYILPVALYSIPAGLFFILAGLIIYFIQKFTPTTRRSLLVFGVSLSLSGALYYLYFVTCCINNLG